MIADNLLVRKAKRIKQKKRKKRKKKEKRKERGYSDVFSSSSCGWQFKLINVLLLGSSMGPASSAPSSFQFYLFLYFIFYFLFISFSLVLANNNFQEKSTQTL